MWPSRFRRHARIVSVAAACLFLLTRVVAAPSLANDELLAMVPAGAEMVSGLQSGQPISFLVMTRSNTVDLTDFQSFTGADLSRSIRRVVMVAKSGLAGQLSEHLLLAIGRYDPLRIIKEAPALGTSETQYLGLRVLVLPPAERNRDVAPDVRWLAVIDGRIAVFGTIRIVQEALSHYVERSPPDGRLMWHLSHIRADDQSWSIVASSVRSMEMVRRSLVPLDASLADPIYDGVGLVLGIHFGRQVEVQYDNEPDWHDPQAAEASQTGAADSFEQPPALRSYSFRDEQNSDRHVIRVSLQQYETWISGQTSLPGEAPPQPSQQLAPRKRIR